MNSIVRLSAEPFLIPSNTVKSVDEIKSGIRRFVELLYVDSTRELCTREIVLEKDQLGQDVASNEAQDPDKGIYAFREIKRKNGQRVKSPAGRTFLDVSRCA